MRLRTCLLIAVSVLLVIGIDGARDRKKNKNRHRDNENTAEDTEEEHGKSGSFFGEQQQDDRRKEKQERVMERLKEKNEREKEEESSEEKDDKDKDKEKNSTASAEIEIPKRLRRTFELTRARELNDGEQRPLNNRIVYSSTKQRMRRTLPVSELKKAEELNGGQVKPVVNKPSQSSYQRLRRTLELDQIDKEDAEKNPLDLRTDREQLDQQHRVRRWPKKDHVNMRKKVKSAKKTLKHKPLRLRRARKYDSMENIDSYVRRRFRKSPRALSDSTEFF